MGWQSVDQLSLPYEACIACLFYLLKYDEFSFGVALLGTQVLAMKNHMMNNYSSSLPEFEKLMRFQFCFSRGSTMVVIC